MTVWMKPDAFGSSSYTTSFCLLSGENRAKLAPRSGRRVPRRRRATGITHTPRVESPYANATRRPSGDVEQRFAAARGDLLQPAAVDVDAPDVLLPVLVVALENGRLPRAINSVTWPGPADSRWVRRP